MVDGNPFAHDVRELPVVTSSNASPGKVSATFHMRGPNGPNGGSPDRNRASAISVNMPAKLGDDCEVPSMATAEISGYARPLRLKELAGGRPGVLAK